MELCPVGAGAASFRLQVPGKAAHGAMRLDGVSAIEKFCLLFKGLLQFEQQRNSAFAHPLFTTEMPAPISIGKISAGDWPSTVAESLMAEGRYGVLPGEQISDAREKFERKIFEICREDPWLSKNAATVEWFEGQFESAETSLDSNFLRVLSESHHEILMQNPSSHGVPYGSDLRFFTNYARIPAVLYGPGDVAQAHTVNEFISLEEVLNTASVVAHFITQWCI
jgi:acetylornithine deacetylase